ncbi:MAG: lipid-binding SYLF domain-containing protein [Halioglobus sp.]|jgi:lipid-binding SYLF domain-containing protein
MTRLLSFLLSAILLAAPMSSYALFGKDNPDEKRAELQSSRSAALKKLYAEKPHSKSEVASAKGYAVFSSIGINLFLVATERGGGILRDNQSGKDTYMQMFSAGGGIGMGVKDFSVIFIFHTVKAMEEFQTEGWDFSGKAEANAEINGEGAGKEEALTVVPGTTIYQLTEAGLALQATLQGTKFWANEDLN